MSQAIKNEVAAIKQEAGAAPPRPRVRLSVGNNAPVRVAQPAIAPAAASQPDAGTKRRRGNSVAADLGDDAPHPSEPRFGSAMKYGDEDFLAKHHAQSYARQELGLTPAGRLNFDTLLTATNGLESSVYYTKMVECGVGEKLRMEWISKKLKVMDDGKFWPFLGTFEGCFVKKAVPAVAGGAQKKVKVEKEEA